MLCAGNKRDLKVAHFFNIFPGPLKGGVDMDVASTLVKKWEDFYFLSFSNSQLANELH